MSIWEDVIKSSLKHINTRMLLLDVRFRGRRLPKWTVLRPIFDTRKVHLPTFFQLSAPTLHPLVHQPKRQTSPLLFERLHPQR
jgi:hypothetical protein